MRQLIPVLGIELGVVSAGLRNSKAPDLLVIRLAEGGVVSGVFTQNSFKAAPVHLALKNLKHNDIRALVVNTGCANAGTGQVGIEDAFKVCEELATILKVTPSQILPFSTGVIMERLPRKKIIKSLATAVENLVSNGWRQAAEAIMTTDTISKGLSLKVSLSGISITITGIAKGSGMIHPNMATMLGFIAVDAKINASVLDEIISSVVESSFNCITVDGDTSTNDSFLLIATGTANNPIIKSSGDPRYKLIYEAIEKVAIELAKMIVKDGEGATKLVTVEVEGGRSLEECKKVAYSIAKSPLVKTAFFAEDPNLGRILSAIGQTDIRELNIKKITVSIDSLVIFERGEMSVNYDEIEAGKIMKKDEFSLNINLSRGNAVCQVWTCDFSHDYVSINADYRS